jgi:hypothetical protein
MTVIIPGFEGNCRENALWENYSRKVSYRVPALLEPASVDDIVRLIRAAESQRKKVRATGSGWSFEDVCHSDHWMVDLGPQLNNKLNTITGVSDILHDRHVTRVVSGPLAGARIPTGNIVHVEAGIKLLDLNRLLDTLQRALPTMGGSQGQQLAGAFATSTHGSDFGHGPLADHVLAVHLVTSGGRQVWIESASRPITSSDDALRRGLPSADTLIIRDDEALNAVTVGLGCFGVIYSVVLEVVPEHELLEWTSKRNVDEMMALLRAGAGQADPLAPFINAMTAGPGPAWASRPERAQLLKYIDITFSSRPSGDAWVRRRWMRNGTPVDPVMPENPNWPDPTAWAKAPDIASTIINGTMGALAASAAVVGGLLPNFIPPIEPISAIVIRSTATAWAASIAVKAREFANRTIGRDNYYAGDALVDAIHTLVDATTGLPPPFEGQSDFVYRELGINKLISEVTKQLLASGFEETTSATPNGKHGRSWNVSAGSSGESGAPHYRVDSMEFIFSMGNNRFVDFLDFVRSRGEAFLQTGYVAIRFTKSASALMSMHNFGGGIAVSIEIACLHGLRGNAKWFRQLQNKAIALGGRMHWGQLNELNALHVAFAYKNTLMRWKEQLFWIAGTSKTFSNAFTTQRYLDTEGMARIVTHVRLTNGKITHLANPESHWSEVTLDASAEHIHTRSMVYLTKKEGQHLSISIRNLIRCPGNLLERLPSRRIYVDTVNQMAGERTRPIRSTVENLQVKEVIRDPSSGKIQYLLNAGEGWQLTYSDAFRRIRSGARYYIQPTGGERVYLKAETIATTRTDDLNDPVVETLPLAGPIILAPLPIHSITKSRP